LIKIQTVYELRASQVREAVLQYMERKYNISLDGNIEFADIIIHRPSDTVQNDCYLGGITVTFKNTVERADGD
jgi:hypothetical protein